jgi:PAS domain S-box-containing protein
MQQAILTIDMERGTALPANAAAVQLTQTGNEPDPPLPWIPRQMLVAGASGVDWLRPPNGRRRLVRWTCAPQGEGGAGAASLILDAADRGALDAAVARPLVEIVDEFDRGGSEFAAWQALARVLRSALRLPLVRILVIESGELHEVAGDGDPRAAAAARLETLEAIPSVPGPVFACMRARELVVTPAECLDRPLSGALTLAGIRAVAALPGGYRGEPLVFELYAHGAGDFDEDRCRGFLLDWLPWLVSQLDGKAQAAQRRLVSEALFGAATPAFITDADGTIVWINHAFTITYGHAAETAIGSTPRLVQSGEHGARYYQAMWSSLRNGRPWSGETVDRTADGELITVHQTITPVRHEGEISHYLSIQSDLTAAAQERAIGEQRRGVDAITGLLTPAAFEHRARDLLRGAAGERAPLVLLLFAVTTRSGGTPGLEPETLAFVRGVIGERIRGALPDAVPATALGAFDFAAMLKPDAVADGKLFARLDAAARQPLPLLGETLELRCHHAMAYFPQDGASLRELRKLADSRLAEQEPAAAH